MGKQLENKLDEIEQRIIKLIEQNAQYRRMCFDLAEAKKKLDAENKLLHETVKEQNAFIQELEVQLQSQSQPVTASVPANTDRNQILQQIEQHIQQLDSTLQWLSQPE